MTEDSRPTMTAVTPGRPLLPENADERRMFDAACETMDLTPLQWIADSLITERNMTSVAGASYWEQRTIAYNELQKAITRLAAKPADEGVREANAGLPTSQFAKYKTIPELEAENAAADRANIKRQIDNASYVGLHKGNYGLKHYLSAEQKQILSDVLSAARAPKP